ncbi:MAG: helix-turn-helix domain-containing protein [Desulfotomaculum sp.]|nr:helix-turn-helix domain-containing protein [Desulfotomaculum sp.]MCL0081457.1 helix-turn-helix domain-containing protein [Peptococcaceae bacterium]
MIKVKSWTPREIRAMMVLKGVTLKNIAEEANVTASAIHQVIYSVGRVKGYRLRPYIAKAIGKKTEEIWPNDSM